MGGLSRRAALAALALGPVPVAAATAFHRPAKPEAADDGAEHIANRSALDADRSDLDAEGNPLWRAYEQSLEAMGQAQPQTMAGALALAQAAAQEALTPQGRQDWRGPQGEWAGEVANALLRLRSQGSA
ncbi:hypothetical protein IAI18_07585 [Acetobacteraceae bacterium H6797]|nr:hypothetical protein [Acetobacteraceae bacterium H6797]